MTEILPAIGNDVEVLSDGTVDVSAAMSALNEEIAEQTQI
jgi:hypothetical protein